MPILESARSITAVAHGVNINSTADTAVTIPNGARRYIVRNITTTNASGNLSTATNQLGVYTAVSKGGTAVVTGATGTLTPLTSSTVFSDTTIANAGTFNASTLYVNVQAGNLSGTVDVYFFIDILDN